MEYGQNPVFQKQPMTISMKVFLSASAVLQPLGILLRVIAATPVGRCTMSSAMATIGQLLLAVTTLTACASATVAASIHPAATIERAGLGSVASKSDSDSGSYEPCSRAHMNRCPNHSSLKLSDFVDYLDATDPKPDRRSWMDRRSHRCRSTGRKRSH